MPGEWWSEALSLFWRFALISVLAFGGGQAALPLVERSAVSEMHWLTTQDFSTALAFSYITPGPVLILATFVGYRAAGLAGAVAATFGVFLLPWVLAAAAAHTLQGLMQSAWLRGFGRGAGPAVVGLLGVTALSIGRDVLSGGWLYVGIGGVASVLALGTKFHPFLILVGGALAGLAISAVPRQGLGW